MLLFATTFLFLGRGWEYLFWSAPLRVLAWDQRLFSPIVEGVFGVSWEAYTADLRVDAWLTYLQGGIGVFFSALAGLAWLGASRPGRWWSISLMAGAGLLTLHALLDTKDHFYHAAQLFEHSIQVATPILLWLAVRFPGRELALLRCVRVVVALTFTAHGLYAIGFYPVPGHFVDMTILILSCSEGVARSFLFFVGWLDLLVAIGVFIPRVARIAFGWAAVWGLATALARTVVGLDVDFFAASLHGNLYQTVYRLPHSLLPALGFLLSSSMHRRQRPESFNNSGAGAGAK